MNSRTQKIFQLLEVENENILENKILSADDDILILPLEGGLCIDDDNGIVLQTVTITSNEDEVQAEGPSYAPDPNEGILSSQEDGVEDAITSNGEIMCEDENNNIQDQDYVPNRTEEIPSNEEDEIECPPKTKRLRKRRSEKNTWVCNENKFKRMKGLNYMGRGQSEDGKALFNKPRSARKMLPFCNCKPSLKGKTFKCRNFTLENRQTIFDEFWDKLTWPERKQYIRGLVNVLPPVKRKLEKDSSRRNVTLVLNLKKDGVSQRVCKKMFLNTLAIGEWSLHNWNKPVPLNDTEKTNQKEKTNPRSAEAKNLVRKFFDNLPKMESHYCRSRSNKLYLEPIWQSKADLYREYSKFSKLENPVANIVSIKTFSLVFEELNISLFIPKKDQCDVCTNFRSKNLSEEEYLQHQRRKEDARKEKENDKVESQHVYCMDLQKVLLSPHSNVSSLYYKRKLCVHNFTIYNMKNNEGFCYIWHEGEGDISAHEFASIICSFISNQNIGGGEEVIIYSDNCGYQNKNVTLSNALFNLSLEKNIIITQKYLEKGHTQMEVDSMHACIERRLKNRDISVPAEYAVHCRKARLLPNPYNVQYLNHRFFRNYSDVKYVSSIRPGIRSGDPMVNDLKALKYTPNKEIYYKLNHTDDWSLLNKRFRKNVQPIPNDLLPNLYPAPRQISKEKFDNLQELKNTLLADFHTFYDQLQFK